MTTPLPVAIVDYRLGNLYSVQRACEMAGMQAHITATPSDIFNARAVLLPGVGAFGDAMATMHRLGLVSVLREVVAAGKPVVGICLGIQLLMTESYEFGRHQGLGFIEGEVKRFDEPEEDGRRLKVPQVGWNRIQAAHDWSGTLLEGVPNHEHMYFVHSYIVHPRDPAVIVSTTRYGDIEFCSSLRFKNIFACQFHPERSGGAGMRFYQNLRRTLIAKETE